MHQLYLTFKTSMKEGRRAQALVGVALFTALDVILSSYASIRIIPNVLSISFASVAVAASGFFFGPWLNMLAGIITDNLSYILYPNGPWFPGWMINAMFIGFFYGIVFYRQPKITLKRCIFARLGSSSWSTCCSIRCGCRSPWAIRSCIISACASPRTSSPSRSM